VNVDHLRGVCFDNLASLLKPDGDLKGVGSANRKNHIPDSDGLSPVLTTCTNGELSLCVVCCMWNAMKTVFLKSALVEAAGPVKNFV